MRRNSISDKLEELYNKESQIYANPIQTRPKPKAGITGEKPEEEIVSTSDIGTGDEDEVKKDLGKEAKKETSINSNKEKNKKQVAPKNWKFKGPRDYITQEK
jgi:hypothetical protein